LYNSAIEPAARESPAEVGLASPEEVTDAALNVGEAQLRWATLLVHQHRCAGERAEGSCACRSGRGVIVHSGSTGSPRWQGLLA